MQSGCTHCHYLPTVTPPHLFSAILKVYKSGEELLYGVVCGAKKGWRLRRADGGLTLQVLLTFATLRAARGREASQLRRARPTSIGGVAISGLTEVFLLGLETTRLALVVFHQVHPSPQSCQSTFVWQNLAPRILGWD